MVASNNITTMNPATMRGADTMYWYGNGFRPLYSI